MNKENKVPSSLYDYLPLPGRPESSVILPKLPSESELEMEIVPGDKRRRACE